MLISFGNFFLPTRLIEPTRLFNFGKFSYLHVISNCMLIKEVSVLMYSQCAFTQIGLHKQIVILNMEFKN